MNDFNKLSTAGGWALLPYIWTVFLSRDRELWANSFEERELRLRCLFCKEENAVYIFLTVSEISSLETLLAGQDNIFLSGAFNQWTVIQVRTTGKISEVLDDDTKKNVRHLMELKLKGKRIPYDNFRKNVNLHDEVKRKKALDLIHGEGTLYCFKPEVYEYNIYDRE